MRDIRNAIPKHCFERSLWRSMSYVVADAIGVAVLAYGASFIDASPLPAAAKWALWAGYWFLAGNVMTGLWVLAHECGHQAFSKSKLVNNVMGTILHSALLVPYHPWRVSHANHHSNCCSIEHDEVFIPSTRSALGEALAESPISSLWGVVQMLVFGWPAYMFCNAGGPRKYDNKVADHFSPWSALFLPQHYWLVVQSDIAWLVAVGGVAYAIHLFGFTTVAAYYLIPYMVVNANLVAITYLQHTDTYVPHYREGAFTNMRGKLSTVDRSVGFIDYLWHHITDTHVLHHIDHSIPHYHAEEATEAIKPLLGDYYLSDSTNFLAALYRSGVHCRCIPDDGDYIFFVGPDNDTRKSD